MLCERLGHSFRGAFHIPQCTLMRLQSKPPPFLPLASVMTVFSTILTRPASRNANGLNYRWHSCMFTPFWDQFQSPCSYIKTFCCSPGPLNSLGKYEAEDCFKIVCSCKMRAVADYITLASFDSTWLLTSLQRSEFSIFYYNICPCRVTVYVWLTEV